MIHIELHRNILQSNLAHNSLYKSRSSHPHNFLDIQIDNHQYNKTCMTLDIGLGMFPHNPFGNIPYKKMNTRYHNQRRRQLHKLIDNQSHNPTYTELNNYPDKNRHKRFCNHLNNLMNRNLYKHHNKMSCINLYNFQDNSPFFLHHMI